jgi:hypothetical protein
VAIFAITHVETSAVAYLRVPHIILLAGSFGVIVTFTVLEIYEVRVYHSFFYTVTEIVWMEIKSLFAWDFTLSFFSACATEEVPLVIRIAFEGISWTEIL